MQVQGVQCTFLWCPIGYTCILVHVSRIQRTCSQLRGCQVWTNTDEVGSHKRTRFHRPHSQVGTAWYRMANKRPGVVIDSVRRHVDGGDNGVPRSPRILCSIILIAVYVFQNMPGAKEW